MVIFPVHFEIRGGGLHFQVSLRWPLRVEAGWQLTERGYLLKSVAQIPESVEILTERSVYAEGTAREAKSYMGCAELYAEGWIRLNIQAMLTAAVQNLKQLAQSKAYQLKEKVSHLTNVLGGTISFWLSEMVGQQPQ